MCRSSSMMMCFCTRKTIKEMFVVIVKEDPQMMEKVKIPKVVKGRKHVARGKALEKYASFPCLVDDEITQVRHALGTYVAWPRQLVDLTLDTIEGISQSSSQNKARKVQKTPSPKPEQDAGESLSNLRVLLSANATQPDNVYQIDMLEEMVGRSHPIFIHSKDIEDLLNKNLLDICWLQLWIIAYKEYFIWGYKCVDDKKILQWKNCTCPRQPGGWECGYYVMMYMLQIIREGFMDDTMVQAWWDCTSYLTDELDEVRETLAYRTLRFLQH